MSGQWRSPFSSCLHARVPARLIVVGKSRSWRIQRARRFLMGATRKAAPISRCATGAYGPPVKTSSDVGSRLNSTTRAAARVASRTRMASFHALVPQHRRLRHEIGKERSSNFSTPHGVRKTEHPALSQGWHRPRTGIFGWEVMTVCIDSTESFSSTTSLSQVRHSRSVL